MPGEKVLIVDDEMEIRELIAAHLKKEGMLASQAECGIKALEMVNADNYDLIVLDIMMSDLDGFEVLKDIRKTKPFLLVVFLSARQEDYDKVLGFGLGADDYVTKPFSPAELTARIKAHIKRHNAYRSITETDEEINSGPLSINLKSYTVYKNTGIIDLSAIEFKLLRFFMENPGRVFTKAQIYNNVWDGYFEDDNSVMVYISHLRDKIEDNPKEPRFIQTLRGIGYKFVKQDD